MARQSGHWLAYLRFDTTAAVRVLHVLCDNRQQLDEVFAIAKGMTTDANGMVLAEYAVWQSGRKIYTHETPNFPERHVVTHKEFMDSWGTAAQPTS